MTYDAEARNISFALAGDVILNRPISQYREKTFLDLVALLHEADVTLGNLESLYHNWEVTYGSNYIGAYQVGAPEMLEEVKWLGFGGLGAAMNHAFDCGEAGLLATLDNCRARGVRTAGVGRSLGEARAPVYVDSSAGRVALMSACTTYNLTPIVHAGPGRHDMPGKPGISILRHDTIHTLPGGDFDALRRIHGGLESREPTSDAQLVLGGQTYRRGDAFGITTRCNAEDLDDIVRYIRGAKKTADFVAFSIHCHENGQTGKYYNAVHRPSAPDFLVEFCHAIVDAGCDVVFGHGPHILRGIEIYKGKPIFYSLGNFVFNVENLERVPATSYRRLGLDDTATPGDWAQKFAEDSLWAWAHEPACYQTVLPICRFEGGELASIDLHPVDLGYGTPLSQRGRPVLATPEVGDAICGFLQDASARFGTKIVKSGDRLLKVAL